GRRVVGQVDGFWIAADWYHDLARRADARQQLAERRWHGPGRSPDLELPNLLSRFVRLSAQPVQIRLDRFREWLGRDRRAVGRLLRAAPRHDNFNLSVALRETLESFVIVRWECVPSQIKLHQLRQREELVRNALQATVLCAEELELFRARETSRNLR